MSDNKTFINFKKADWSTFKTTTEGKFAKLSPPSNVYKAEKKFRKIINKASKQCIPSGRIKQILPEIPASAAENIKKRDQLRETNPNSEEITNLNYTINKEIRDHKRAKWREEVSKVENGKSGKLFKIIKNLNGNAKASKNQAISFNNKQITCPAKIANNFNKQYSSVVTHKTTKEARKIGKNIKKLKRLQAPHFTIQQTTEVLKKCKSSKALGPDKISNLHLKHLGDFGTAYLTCIFNLSLDTGLIPDIWKQSVIIPLLKPGKDPSVSTSYRPVSLLSPAIKVMERLLLPSLNEHLTVPDHQHGFRKNHSTVSALNDFNQQVSEGFNQIKPPDRTLLLQIDLSKAFDMVSHNKLIQDLNNSTLPAVITRWFSTYLRGRQSRVNFRDTISTSRNVRTGVPQGAVTSPICFNYYLTNLPTPPEGIRVVQYADDISIYISGTDIDDMTSKINSYIDKVLDFLEERELQVSPEKSTVTLFTPDPAQAKLEPAVKMRNKQVKLDKSPKLLGVHFDTMHSFSHHTSYSVNKAKKKLNILKCLAGTDWGQDQETMVMTYKAVIRSILEYAAPIWDPIISDSGWAKLQTVQNQALRIATGCYINASQSHLHQETKVLPIREHSAMITKQSATQCHNPTHPGFKHLDKPPAPRAMKLTLQIHETESRLLLNMNNQDRKLTNQLIHTDTVSQVISKYPPNRVLDARPPGVDESVLKLDRKDRALLCQLRSGFCKILSDYQARLDPSLPDHCPKCRIAPPRCQPPVLLHEVPHGPVYHRPLDQSVQGPGVPGQGGLHLAGRRRDVLIPPAATTTTTT